MASVCKGKLKYIGLITSGQSRHVTGVHFIYRPSCGFKTRTTMTVIPLRSNSRFAPFNICNISVPGRTTVAQCLDIGRVKSHFWSSAFTSQAEDKHIPNVVHPSPSFLLDQEFPERLSHDGLGAREVAVMMDMLLNSQYSQLIRRYTWMHKNLHIAFIQILLNDLLQGAMREIQQHPTFAVLRSLASSNLKDMDDEMLLKTTTAALYLGEEQAETLIHQLVIQIRQRVPTIHRSNLGSVSQILKTVRGTDVFLIKALCGRLDEVLKAGVKCESTAEDHHSVCAAMVNTLPFVSKELIVTFLGYLQETSENKSSDQWLSNPDHIGMLATVLQKVWRRLKRNGFEVQANIVVDRLMEACYEAVNNFDCHNIAEVCHALKTLRRYDYKLSLVMQERATQLLDSDCQLRDISNLFYCVTPKAGETLKRTLQMRLLSKLKPDMPDIVIISNLATSLPDLGFIDKDLLLLFQHVIAASADKLVIYISRYEKVSRFLQRKKFIDRASETTFVETLSRHLDLHLGPGMYGFPAIATFMLSSYTDSLPNVLYQKMKDGIPHWKDHDLYRLATGLHALRRPLSRRMREQIDEIQLLLHSSLARKVDNIDSLDKLCSLTFRFGVQNKISRDPTLTSKLMDTFPEFHTEFSLDNMFRVLQVFQSLKYHIPEIYDDMVRLALDNSDQLSAQQILTILKATAQVGYQPQRFDGFLLCCLDAYAGFEEHHQYKQMLETALNLIHLSYSPEEELTRLFTLETIQTLDEHMLDQNGSRFRLAELMMELNRAVVLECPQLQVPWFHEGYCCENIVRDEPTDDPAMTRFRDELEEMLGEVLGSEDLTRRWVYSPYFYTIDVECVLDEENEAVSTREISDTGVSKSCQRVAILALGEDCYCYNSKELDGPTQTKVRHLEMMGYKVVLVPHYEWYSMGLSEWQAKAEYLQDKVLDQNFYHSE